MTKEVRLAEAQEKDIDFILSTEKAEEGDAFIQSWTKSQHLKGLADEKLQYLMILTEDKIIGFFILGFDADETSMEFKRVVITDKGRGFGQLAIRAMITYVFSQLDKTRLWLDVYEENTWAQHIYEKLGFVFQRTEPYQGRVLKIYQLDRAQDS